MINLLQGDSSQYKDPEVSPDGPTTTAPLDEATAARNAELVDKYAASLYDATAADILTWAHEHAPGPLVVTLSMENTVLAELSKQFLPGADFLFLDTEYHFAETLEVADKVEQRYPDNRLVRATAQLSRAEQDEVYGPNLYRRNPTACCRMRKVEPLRDSLGAYDAWVTGVRRDEGPTRADAPVVSFDETFGLVKINPLVTWSLEDLLRFSNEHRLPVNLLVTNGYPSIGCEPCTRPVEDGDDARAGRWSGFAKTECGLHA